jgi:hypothetical protein
MQKQKQDIAEIWQDLIGKRDMILNMLVSMLDFAMRYNDISS